MHRPRRFPFQVIAAVVLAAAWVTVVLARSGAHDSSLPYLAEAVKAAPPGTALAASAAPAMGARGTPAQQPATPPPGMRLPPIGAKQAGATYVGDETCLTCHEGQKKGYAGSAHGRADHPRAPGAKMGCETCHGPGSKHAEEETLPGLIRTFVKEPPKEANETCLTCHERGNHALWAGSVHESRNLSCATCHSAHQSKSATAMLKTVRETQTCATCHRDKAAKIDRSGHMPLREGKMECSTCHNPHGSTNVKQLRKGDSIADTCTSCHADKRGPFLWEHAPGRDGCTTCHDPHGTSNERMLVTKPPILCQRCHIATRHPSTIYDGALIGSGASPSVRIYARSCLTCHSTIHGSNHPSGQRFIR